MASIQQKIEKAAVELSNARERLEAAQRNFDSLLKLISKPSAIAVAEKEDASPKVNLVLENPISNHMTHAERLLDLMNSSPNLSWGYEEISKQMPNVKLKALRVIVHGLKKKGKIISIGHGYFKAVDPQVA